MPGLKTMAVLRKEKGWTQFDVAREIGVTQTEISLYENGRARPGNFIGRRLVKLFQVPDLEYLLMPYTEYIVQLQQEIQHDRERQKIRERDKQLLEQMLDSYDSTTSNSFETREIDSRVEE